MAFLCTAEGRSHGAGPCACSCCALGIASPSSETDYPVDMIAPTKNCCPSYHPVAAEIQQNHNWRAKLKELADKATGTTLPLLLLTQDCLDLRGAGIFKRPSWPDWPLIRFGSSTEAEGCSGRSRTGPRRTCESRGAEGDQKAENHRGTVHVLCGTTVLLGPAERFVIRSMHVVLS